MYGPIGVLEHWENYKTLSVFFIRILSRRTGKTAHSALLQNEPFFVLLLLLTINIVDQTFSLDDLLHEFRERLAFEAGSFCLVGNDPAVEIHFHLISCLNVLCRLRTFNDRQTNIDGVSVKNAGKRLSAMTQLTPAALIAMGACSRRSRSQSSCSPQ